MVKLKNKLTGEVIELAKDCLKAFLAVHSKRWEEVIEDLIEVADDIEKVVKKSRNKKSQ